MDSVGYWSIFASSLSTKYSCRKSLFRDRYQYYHVMKMDRERLTAMESFTYNDFRAFIHAYGEAQEACDRAGAGDCPVWENLLSEKDEIMTKVASGEINANSLARGTAKVASLYDSEKGIDSVLWGKFRTCAQERLADASWDIPLLWSISKGGRDVHLDDTPDEENPITCALREFKEETGLTITADVRDRFAYFRPKNKKQKHTDLQRLEWNMCFLTPWEGSQEGLGEEDEWKPVGLTETSLCKWFSREEVETLSRSGKHFMDITIVRYSLQRLDDRAAAAGASHESGR